MSLRSSLLPWSRLFAPDRADRLCRRLQRLRHHDRYHLAVAVPGNVGELPKHDENVRTRGGWGHQRGAVSVLDWLFLGVAVLVQLVVLYAPRGPSVGGIPGIDKVIHLLIFAVVGIAARRCGVTTQRVVLVLAAHAVLSEILQAVALPGRSGDPWDVVADVAGVAVAVLLVGQSAGQRSRGP